MHWALASGACARLRFTKRVQLTVPSYQLHTLNYRAAKSKIYTRMAKNKVRKIQHKSLQGIESVLQRGRSSEEERSKDRAQGNNTEAVDTLRVSDCPVSLVTRGSTRGDPNRTSLGRTMSSSGTGRAVRAVGGVLVNIRIHQHLIDDMDDAVLSKDVRLDDLSSGVARRDKLSGRVGGKVEVFSTGGNVSGSIEAGAIDRRSVDDVVPQNSPKRGLVA